MNFSQRFSFVHDKKRTSVKNTFNKSFQWFEEGFWISHTTSLKIFIKLKAVLEFSQYYCSNENLTLTNPTPPAHTFTSARYASCVGGVNELCEEVSMAAAAAPEEISGPKSTEFLGYKLNRDQTETALNALFGLEITFFLLAIIALFKARRK